MKLIGAAITIHDLIDRAAISSPAEAFLISPETGEIVTKNDLRERCIHLSAWLAARGLQSGDKVALMMDNGLMPAQLFLGVMYGGFVVVPLNVRSGVTQLSYMLDHRDAKAVFVEEHYRALFQEAMKEVARPIEAIAPTPDVFIRNGTASLPVTNNLPAPGDEALRPLDCHAVLFRARDSHKAHLHAYDPTLGWDGLFARGLDLFEMPGDHSTILLRENLPGLASLVQEHLPVLDEDPSLNLEPVEISVVSRR
jgi:acyl-CoA synthetase (AMP-forming)/AMP-acid ligase II